MLHLAYKDRRTPWYAKVLIFVIIAYALSPIDLIPDFIPIIGYLDDLILLPIGIYFAVRLIPENVKAECSIKAALLLSLVRSRLVRG
nr:YkvA family protein [Aequorivita sp. CIP111184]